MQRLIAMTSAVWMALGVLVCPKAEAAEPLSGDEVNQVVSENYQAIVECYMEHAAKQKSASGEVRVRWVVLKSGRVDNVKVEAPGVKGKTFAGCVTNEVESWRFREIAGSTEVEYPFTFQRTHVPGAGPQRR